MKLLLDERKCIIAISNEIEYGIWGNVGNLASWKIAKTNYCMDNNYSLVEIADNAIPTYVRPYEYYFINGEFKLADECPNEYKDRIIVAEESISVIEDALCETETYNDERMAAIEDALCELSTLLA